MDVDLKRTVRVQPAAAGAGSRGEISSYFAAAARPKAACECEASSSVIDQPTILGGLFPKRRTRLNSFNRSDICANGSNLKRGKVKSSKTTRPIVSQLGSLN